MTTTHTFTLNGEQVTVEVPGDGSVGLLYVLRDLLGVTGPKYGCGVGVCRACTSHKNGEPFEPCIEEVGNLEESDEITTIEGLADDDDLHPVQQAWLELDVAQCGYCQPGQIMKAAALIEESGEPSDEQIDNIKNICRCGTYFRIRQAIKRAAGEDVGTETATGGAGSGADGDAGQDDSGEDDDGLLGGLLGTASAGDITEAPAPTRNGVGKAGLIAAAAEAIRRGKQERGEDTPDSG